MNNFKFIYREEELDFAKKAFSTNNFIVYYYLKNSGLSHYLKKLQIDLCTEKNICFYVDCERNNEIAVQIAEQIISGCDQVELTNYLKKKKKGEITKNIVKSFFTALDIVPYVNLGEIGKSLMDAISDTNDVDIAHLSDYKIEKAIINLFHSLERSNYIDSVYILIDNASILSPNSLDFIVKLMTYCSSKIMLAISNNNNSIGNETLSKLSKIEFCPFEIKKVFERPDNRLIHGLFHCYNRSYKEDYLDLFERHERNIHIIMSFIRGFNMNYTNIDIDTILILKILLIVNTALRKDILDYIYQKTNSTINAINKFNYMSIIEKLENMKFIFLDINNNIYLNKKVVNEDEIKITLIERITICRDILDIFEMFKNELNVFQLKFAINNLDKDYSRRKSYILILLKNQKKSGSVEQQYLDMLFYLDNKKELLEICSMYYDLQVYDVPYLRIKQHSKFIKERESQILIALLRERLHEGDYSKSLQNIIEKSTNKDEKCLLMAVFFQALFNMGKSNQCMQILYNSSHKYYYKNFESSSKYHFLLRNVSYYINDVEIAIGNYNLCLSKFKNSDPVNYNRTMSNFICYLMKHDKNSYAKIVLEEKVKEVIRILDFNDPKYLFLSNNYGIYLTKTNKGDPYKYFDAIIFESGTTETPFIYAQINYALHIAKKNSAKALLMLDEIYHRSVRESKVVPTKIFYFINRILVEYMNDINNVDLLDYIKNNPLRGDKEYAKSLYNSYFNKFKFGIKYCEADWNNLFLPGYLFYHGFSADLLLLNFR